MNQGAPTPLRGRKPASALLLLATVLLASGCAQRTLTAGGKGATSRSDQISSAAASPLNDFNLMQVQIPAILLAARAKPYATPAKLECAPMLASVLALDEALGPDVDAPPASGSTSLADAGTTAVGDATVGAFRGAVENLVPFRGWVRRLSGADQYERDVAAALAAGMARRAYIKGLMQAHGCLDMAGKNRAAPGGPLVAPPPLGPATGQIPPLPPPAPATASPVTVPQSIQAQPLPLAQPGQPQR
jgi:hypothetical protein